MIKFGLKLILLFLPLAAVAEGTLLSKIAAKTANIKTISGEFQQLKRIAALPLPLKSSGRFHYQAGKGMEWHTLVPMESRLLLSQEGFQFDDRSGITKSFGSAQLASTFLGAFSGNLESLEPLFEISATGTLESWCLQMTPKNNLVADQIAEVQICGGNTTESVTIAEANGDSTELAFVANSIELQQ